MKKIIARLALVGFIVIGFIVGGIRTMIQSEAAEMRPAKISEVRQELLRDYYGDFIQMREEVGHYDVVYTDDGFELILDEPADEIYKVIYSIKYDYILVVGEDWTETVDWDWREYI